MDETMEIKKRRYDSIYNEITDTLYQYVKDKNIGLSMVRSGVVINDTREIISLVATSSITYATFLVETATMKVIRVNIDPHICDKYFGAFDLKDKKKITDYLMSFEGTTLDLYSKGNNYE